MGVCTKERKGATAEVLRATPCTNSLGGESGEQKHEGCGGHSACWRERVGFIENTATEKVGFIFFIENTAMRLY